MAAAWQVCSTCGSLEDDDGVCGECNPDHVNAPKHYTRLVVEPITYIMRNGMEFWRGNIIKYSSRAGFKTYDGKTQEESEITDLEKVKRYCDMRISQIKGGTQL